MSNVMQDTIKQLYNLIWFCKKVSIPFEVYAFTNEWRRSTYDEKGNFMRMEPHYQKKSGLICVDETFSMMNLFTSKVNNRVLEEQMINIYRIAKEFKYSYNDAPMYNTPTRLLLSGTPLNEALIAMHQILPKFQKENKLQKVQCVVLTDGEACYMKFHKEFKNRSVDGGEPYIGLNSLNSHPTFIRDRKTGCTYKVPFEFHQFTDTLLQNLRDRFPSVNFIGMRVLEKIPAKLAQEVSKSVKIPTIGIGAGPHCDGQVLVINDMIGLTKGFKPRFLRQYLNLFDQINGAVQTYVKDVKSGEFPDEKEQY